MADQNVLNVLYTKKSSPLELYFNTLSAPPLLSLLTIQDIFELNRIAKSVKLSGKIDEKYKIIDKIMGNRGFIKLHAGTNRVVYRFIEDQRFVIKVAVDRVGLGDNPAEFRNQFLLKPFVTKVFEVSPCGTVGLFERVDAIMSREEFLSVADDVFNLITKFFVGKYILEDFGAWYFLNWGIRRNGMGLVLLDFPYVYELDGNKLYCNANPIPGRRDIVCGGQLDYDDGFNNLICTKCGKHYHARDLKKAEENKLIIVGGKKTMKVKVMRGNEVVKDSSKKQVAKVIEPEPEVKTSIPVIKKPRAGIFNRADDAEEFNKVKEDTVIETRELAAVLDTNKDKSQEEVESEPQGEIEAQENESEDSNEETLAETVDDLNEVLDSSDEDYPEEEYDEDYEDAQDYDSYMSNRDRKQARKAKKAIRNNNSDFSEY